MSKSKIDKEVEIPCELIKELLTESELRMLKRRVLIIKLLEEGYPTRRIAKEIKVGTDTVVRVLRKLEKNHQLKNFFNKAKKNLASKWVFGKVGSEE